MNRVAPYYLLDRDRLARIELSLQPALAEISSRWWLKTDGVRIKAQEYASSEAIKNSAIRHVCRCGDQYLLFVGADKQWSIAASEWLGCSVDHPSPLTKELESQYCQELASSISPDIFSSHCDDVDTQAILLSYLRPGAGGLILEVTINGFTHSLLTTAAMFPHIFEQENTVGSSSLTNIVDVLGDSAVLLEAYLAPSRVPLMDVASLIPGDFLNLKHDLSGEIVLIGKNSEVLIKAELGQRGNNKAALIVAENGN